MPSPKMEDNLGKHERKLVAEIRQLKSRLTRFEQNELNPKCMANGFQESKTSFCTLFDNMAQDVFYQMPDGHIRRANQAMLDIFGLTLDQLQGRTSITPQWRVIHEDGSEFPGETHPSWQALQTGKEIRNVTAGIFSPQKNDYVWVSINAIPEFRADQDTPHQVFVTMHDITERKRAEAALHESEERFRLLLENCPDLIIVQSPTGLVTFVSSQAEVVLGHPAARFERKGFPDIIHPDDLDRVKKKYAQITEDSEEVLDFEYRIIDGDGDIRWVSHTARQILKDGKTSGVQSNIRNITKQKHTEEILRKSDERIRNSLDKLIEGCQIVGYDWRFLYLNDAAARQGRKPKEEFLGRTMMEVLPGIEDSDMFARLKQCMEERTMQHMENEFIYSDGQKGWFELSIQPVQEGIFILSIDVTERRHAEESLRLSEQRLELAHEATGMGMFDWDIENDQAVCNERYFRLFGLEPQERMLCEDDWLAMLHTDDRERVRREVSQTVKHGAPYDTEYRVICPDGSERWVSSTAKMFHTDDGKPSRMIGAMTDITHRKKAEESLRDSEKRSRAWLEHSPVCTKIVDLDFNLQYMSTAGIRGLGIDDITQFYGKPYPFEFYPESFRKRMTENLERVKETGEVIVQEASVMDMEGNELWFHSTLVPVNDNEGRIEYIIVVSMNTTERRQAERQIIENQAQLKSLASELVLTEERERNRIAIHMHDDVCQNLAYSKMKLQMVHTTLDNQVQLDDVTEVTDTLTRMMQDVHSLTFELSTPVLTELGLEAAVSNWLEEQIEQKHGIATEFIDDGQVKTLEEDIQALLFRSIRELLANVVKHSQANRVKVAMSRCEGQILVRLEDDGIGFALDRIVIGKATDTGGYGLFSIRERLSQFGGSLIIESEPGQGCEATLRAPLQQP